LGCPNFPWAKFSTQSQAVSLAATGLGDFKEGCGWLLQFLSEHSSGESQKYLFKYFILLLITEKAWRNLNLESH